MKNNKVLFVLSLLVIAGSVEAGKDRKYQSGNKGQGRDKRAGRIYAASIKQAQEKREQGGAVGSPTKENENDKKPFKDLSNKQGQEGKNKKK